MPEANLTIAEFLEARIAEDEAKAHNVLVFRINPETGMPGNQAIPARVLAECAAKRAVIKSYLSCQYAEASYDIRTETGAKLVASGMVKGLELAVKYLAATYHTHPEYERDWADETIRSMRDHEVIPHHSDSGHEK